MCLLFEMFLSTVCIVVWLLCRLSVVVWWLFGCCWFIVCTVFVDWASFVDRLLFNCCLVVVCAVLVDLLLFVWLVGCCLLFCFLFGCCLIADLTDWFVAF